MWDKSQLSKLTPNELLLLDKHVKLGKSHLRESLTEGEVEEVYQLGSIPKAAEEELKLTKIEIVSQYSLAINAIVTGTLGGWMGLSAFLQFRLNSLLMFVIIFSFSTFLGTCVGLTSGRLRRKFSNVAKERRQAQDLEIAILNEINEMRKEEVQEKTKELVSILAHLEIREKISEIENLEHLEDLYFRWINQLQQIGKEKYENSKNYEDFVSEIEKANIFFRKSKQKESIRGAEETKLYNIIQKLSRSSIQPSAAKKSWVRENLQSLIVGFLPTIFGGFGSLFVYIGGAPSIAKELGKENLLNFLLLPQVKLIQLIMLISITLYFGFSFIYLTLKDHKRDKELSKLNVYITKEESQTHLLDDKLLKVKEMLDWMKKFEYLFYFLKKSEE